MVRYFLRSESLVEARHVEREADGRRDDEDDDELSNARGLGENWHARRRPDSGARQKSEVPSNGSSAASVSMASRLLGWRAGRSPSLPSPPSSLLSSSSSSSSANASSRMAMKRFMTMKKPMISPGRSRRSRG